MWFFRELLCYRFTNASKRILNITEEEFQQYKKNEEVYSPQAGIDEFSGNEPIYVNEDMCKRVMCKPKSNDGNYVYKRTE